MSTSTKTRISLAEAESLAAELLALLDPACSRIAVAGSIRRMRPTVGDIEILSVPRISQGLDLFGQPTGQGINALDDLCAAEVAAGRLQTRLDDNGRGAWGERYKRLQYQGVVLDLFSCLAPAQWGVLYLIRTGPADFSRRFVTQRQRGGVLPNWAVVEGGAVWHGTEPFATPEEADVFRFLGFREIPPECRVGWESWDGEESRAGGPA